MLNKCTSLWREAHLQVKKLKTPHVWSTFGSWDVEKAHAVLARSTFFGVQCRFAWQAHGILHVAKSEQTRRFCRIFNYNHHYATLHSTTLQLQLQLHLHCLPLHYITLHYTTLHYTKLHYNYNYTTLITLYYATLENTTPHHTTLHHTTLNYTTEHYTTLHYITLRFVTLHYITLHYLHHHTCPCNYTTLTTLQHTYNSTTQ